MKGSLIFTLLIVISLLAGCISFVGEDDDSNTSNLFVDTDSDGIADKDDAFPEDPAASLDSDMDGYPDNWNPNKNQDDSTSEPKLIIDEFPNDPNEYKDSDGDKVGDNSDVFPNDPNEWSDLDFDGIGDNSDINPNVDLSLEVNIDKFIVNEKVDLLRWAQIYIDLRIGSITERFDNNGKFYKVFLGDERRIDQSLSFDIPDDTTSTSTEIEIIMYDDDFFGADDIVDITEDLSTRKLVIVFDHLSNEVELNDFSEGSKASIWFNIKTSKNVVPPESYSLKYKWRFDSKLRIIDLDIPKQSYENYLSSTVNRIPQNQINPNKAMASFVTYNDKTIEELSNYLDLFAKTENYNQKETADLALSFVQKTIDYTLDNETKGCIEYWKFPVETLVEKQGDCEDTAALYAAIMKNLGYDVALIFYTWKENGENLGHMATGVHLEGNHGSYVSDSNGKRYFYCETTTAGYVVGDLPTDLTASPKSVIVI